MSLLPLPTSRSAERFSLSRLPSLVLDMMRCITTWLTMRPQPVHVASSAWLLLGLAGALTAPGSAYAQQLDFLAEHCLDCHSGSSPEGGLDLEQLASQQSEPGNYERWVRVYDRVADGEMPPPDTSPLEPPVQQAFLRELGGWLKSSQLQRRAEWGRVGPRRLTNLQLERTLQDLLGIDIPLAVHMPEEPRTGEYTTLAEKQSLSHYQLAEHVKIVDLALDEAFARSLTADDTWRKELSAADIARTRTRTREPELIDGEAVVWSGRLAFYGRLPAITARQDGWYRVTFSARSLKHAGPGGVWCTVRSGKCVSSAAQLSWVGSFEAFPTPGEFSFEAWLPAGHMLEIRPGDPTLKQARFAGGQSANGEGGAQDVPGLAISRLTLERIHRGASDADIRERLFGPHPVDVQAITERAKTERATVDIDSAAQATAAHALMSEFATRAFRRPATSEQLQPYLDVFDATLQSSGSFIDALRAGYRAILCSARFMYFHEPPGPLDDYALAARLSYWLWNTLPDEELSQLASQSRLREPGVLAQQVERMLQSDRGQRFVVDFAAQWLELQDIGFTEPDPRLYPKFDMIVQHAMLDETHHFLQYMLDRNLPISQLIDGRFTFLNSRLASYYGIDGVSGDALQRVELEESSIRGGLLAQGAVLKVTANGTSTSPVVRGVWVSERLLGCPIPPPPASVPAIEPDIRGAETIRQQLAKHRSDSACSSCHVKIDPPGFALENFDAAGAWRDRYPAPRGGKAASGLPIDASALLPDGTPFANFLEFRALQARQAQPLAENLVSHLISYGTGAKPEFADRQEIASIATATREDDYGLRSLIHAIAASTLFLEN